MTAFRSVTDPLIHHAFLANLARTRVDQKVELLKIISGRLTILPSFVTVEKDLKDYMETVDELKKLGEKFQRIHHNELE